MLLGGCKGGDAADGDDADVAGQVLVTTTVPVSQTFHDTMDAWGNAVADPHHASVMSLGHGGLVTALNVIAGEHVHGGEAMLRVAPDPAARNAYRQAQSTLALASGELKRTEQMVTQHLATQSQLAAAHKALDDAQAGLDAQRALGGGVAEEIVSAPADGMVTALNVNLGDRFQAGAPLLSVAPAQGLIARLGVQPDEVLRLKPGMPAQVQAAFGAASGLKGQVSMVGQSVDTQTHLVPVQVTLPSEASATLVAGAAVRATIDTLGYTAWALPRNAVLQDDQGAYVFAVEHDKAKRINVALKHPQGDTVGVQGPLDAKTRIIVSGNYELNDGDAVREQQGSPK
ncbi:efflux RND transporter periplasmic adaptor subunit [Dyella monticola]|uniref:Efflux RND transporter periplasmic adaptor subunit n=2 Tax=Dyella monticola TaxID=1927958 RepID=A0A370WU84_9GAMM|nr:efflux RND transporter periplasmic adaptor subunit [Dyella monticola]